MAMSEVRFTEIADVYRADKWVEIVALDKAGRLWVGKLAAGKTEWEMVPMPKAEDYREEFAKVHGSQYFD